jgi:hypothetical protein
MFHSEWKGGAGNLFMKGIKFTPESISKIGAYCTSYADFKKCGVFLK